MKIASNPMPINAIFWVVHKKTNVKEKPLSESFKNRVWLQAQFSWQYFGFIRSKVKTLYPSHDNTIHKEIKRKKNCIISSGLNEKVEKYIILSIKLLRSYLNSQQKTTEIFTVFIVEGLSTRKLYETALGEERLKFDMKIPSHVWF